MRTGGLEQFKIAGPACHLRGPIWSAAATTPLWLYRSSRPRTAKAVSPSEADSATAIHMGRRAGPGRYTQPWIALIWARTKNGGAAW